MTRFLVADTADKFQLWPILPHLKECGWTFAFLAVLLLATGSAFAGNSSIIAPGAKLEKLADGYGFTQGPSADGDGNVFFTDFQNNRIVEWSAADGKFSDWLTPAGGAIGTSFDKAGNLVTAAAEKGELWPLRLTRKLRCL